MENLKNKNNSTENRKDYVKQLIEAFYNEFDYDEYVKEYALKLVNTVSKKMYLERGNPKIWAASIIWLIARINFLFDKRDKNYHSTDRICDYFSAKKRTISAKASAIEKECRISQFDERFCRPEIYEMINSFTMVNGFIMIEKADEKDEEELRRNEEERRRKKEQEKKELAEKQLMLKRKREEMKRKKMKEGGQLDLFD